MSDTPRVMDCPIGARHGEQLRSHEKWMTDMALRQGHLEEMLDKVRNRLPIWATLMFALLTGVIGWLVKVG